ncbi:MAG: hypothetical protein SVR94_03525 [Pseudomonadota bacterium]|nr:hypothetical protein [Pseudomonadota bacterium]
MTTQPILESGMTFGPYLEGYCFYIEKSKIYKSIQKDVKIAEFLLLRSSQDIWIIEAKSSTPRPTTKQNFDEFIEEICQKLLHALFLTVAICLGRHQLASEEFPEQFKTLDLAIVNFRLVLVINRHRDEWLSPLKENLVKALRPILKTWAISADTSVTVLNDDLARKHGLILSNH